MIKKFKIGKRLFTVDIEPTTHGQLKVKFPYHPDMVDEVKMMGGARWHPEGKYWTISDSQRNAFQIEYLTGGNPFEPYDCPLIDYEVKDREIEPYNHQIEMVKQILTRRHTIIGAEMGTGKTLAAILAIEEVYKWWDQAIKVYWVAPKSAIEAVKLEFYKWKTDVKADFFTYEGLRSLMNEFSQYMEVPRVVIFDEASKAKNPTAQRSQAAAILAGKIRKAYGRESLIVEMSGTPAPKDPSDWWHLSEIACPGFLREGDKNKLLKTLAVIHQKESISGGVYPKLITWRDDERKCEECGKLKDDLDHEVYHEFKPVKNEVARLYRRLKGLTLIKFKKDCLDLPEKQYRIIRLKPKRSTLNAAELIRAKSSKAIQALTLLRELSDGFQYKDIEIGEQECPLCRGTRQYYVPNYADYRVCLNCGDDHHYDQNLYLCIICGNQLVNPKLDGVDVLGECCNCHGEGRVPRFGRDICQIDTPKEQALIDLLDEHEDVGRLVIYAGFWGSIERCVSIVKKQKWHFVKVDGKGWDSDFTTKPQEMLKRFQYDNDPNLKIAFIGHPGAGGMGLTLTASPSIVFYSNDFNAESRMQAEDRIHRPGLDLARGATIIDLFHLDTDEYIYDNIQKKRDLQAISMGELRSVSLEHSGRE